VVGKISTRWGINDLLKIIGMLLSISEK